MRFSRLLPDDDLPSEALSPRSIGFRYRLAITLVFVGLLLLYFEIYLAAVTLIVLGFFIMLALLTRTAFTACARCQRGDSDKSAVLHREP